MDQTTSRLSRKGHWENNLTKLSEEERDKRIQMYREHKKRKNKASRLRSKFERVSQRIVRESRPFTLEEDSCQPFRPTPQDNTEINERLKRAKVEGKLVLCKRKFARRPFYHTSNLLMFCNCEVTEDDKPKVKTPGLYTLSSLCRLEYYVCSNDPVPLRVYYK